MARTAAQIFTAAHALTRRTMAEAPAWWIKRHGIDYRGTFALCLRAVYAQTEDDRIVEAVKAVATGLKWVAGVSVWERSGHRRAYINGRPGYGAVYVDLVGGAVVVQTEGTSRDRRYAQKELIWAIEEAIAA